MTNYNSIYKIILKISVIITFFLICATFSACYTVETAYYEPEELKNKDYEEISEIKLKNDSVIHLENQDVNYINNTDTNNIILLCERTDSILVAQSPGTKIKIKKSVTEIKLQDIMYAKVRKKELDAENTSLLMKCGIGILALLGLLVLGNTFTVVGGPF